MSPLVKLQYPRLAILYIHMVSSTVSHCTYSVKYRLIHNGQTYMVSKLLKVTHDCFLKVYIFYKYEYGFICTHYNTIACTVRISISKKILWFSHKSYCPTFLNYFAIVSKSHSFRCWMTAAKLCILCIVPRHIF